METQSHFEVQLKFIVKNIKKLSWIIKTDCLCKQRVLIAKAFLLNRIFARYFRDKYAELFRAWIHLYLWSNYEWNAKAFKHFRNNRSIGNATQWPFTVHIQSDTEKSCLASFYRKSPWTLEATARQFFYAVLLFTLHSHMFVRLCFAASWVPRDMRTKFFRPPAKIFLLNLPELSLYFFSIVFDSLNVTHVVFVGAYSQTSQEKLLQKSVFSIKISAKSRNESKKFCEKQKLSRVFWASQQSFQFCRFYFAAKISFLWVFLDSFLIVGRFFVQFSFRRSF